MRKTKNKTVKTSDRALDDPTVARSRRRGRKAGRTSAGRSVGHGGGMLTMGGRSIPNSFVTRHSSKLAFDGLLDHIDLSSPDDEHQMPSQYHTPPLGEIFYIPRANSFVLVTGSPGWASDALGDLDDFSVCFQGVVSWFVPVWNLTRKQQMVAALDRPWFTMEDYQKFIGTVNDVKKLNKKAVVLK